MLLNPDNTYGHSYGKFPTILNRLGFILTLPFPNKKSEEKLFEGAFHVDYITGADMFLTRETFEKAGLFDTAFFMYYEETCLQKQDESNWELSGSLLIHLRLFIIMEGVLKENAQIEMIFVALKVCSDI